MPDLAAARRDLSLVLGSYLDRGRRDGIFNLALGGPGSVPALAGLDVPELHLDLLPGAPTAEQRSALTHLGYVPEDGPAGETGQWTHPGGWRLVLPDPDSGWGVEQAALRALLLEGAGAAQRYRAAFLAGGRAAADEALRDEATRHQARHVGLAPAHFVAAALEELNLPWMVAGGVALDLHLGTFTRPHDDLDAVLPRAAQLAVRDALSAGGWRLDACQEGAYQAWTTPLEAPAHQVHARHPGLPGAALLDLLLTDLDGGLWRYRRDPRVTLPLAQARRPGPDGLPYLAPEAVLLFKSGSAGTPRPKDQRDFGRVLPALSPSARAWLASALEVTAPGHPWLAELT